MRAYDGQDGCRGAYFFYESHGHCNCPRDDCELGYENQNAGGAGQLYRSGCGDSGSASGSFVYVDQAKSFDDARAYCRAHYHDLASIHSSSENAAVAALCPGECWIGGSDAAQEGTWTWSDGTAWDYENWEFGEPNNGGGDEPYIVISDSGRWNDESRYGTYPFVCATTFTITSSNVHWDECPGECAAIGGTFTCIDDESQNIQALAAFRGHCPGGADDCGAWIAVSDEASEGNWVCTADGSPQTYQPWSAIGNEPNGGPGENCVNMWGPNSGRNDGAWNDYGCTDARMPCICKGGDAGAGGTSTTTTGTNCRSDICTVRCPSPSLVAPIPRHRCRLDGTEI